ncbi:dual specificity mitogen-activated protein kinase kinase 4-like [Orbicella faveolata]|uniref:dual specificity mitogen-activated protein kinase kinase 4-like n=1 Tax=Orbicella faveolata TaxID=48498 RepID=UPI0009E1BC38|nr:dual specificity mitogen-activated protein kinase kinase 4-like [Orbicella faveolata]
MTFWEDMTILQTLERTLKAENSNLNLGPCSCFQRIRSTVDEKEQKQLLMDLDVVMRSSACEYIVKFYGALFTEGDAWICMELMDTSFDQCYKHIYGVLLETIPEDILGMTSLAVVKALDYLKTKLNIIHRGLFTFSLLLV